MSAPTIPGSDRPHTPPGGDLVDLIPLFAPEQHRILVSNPARLFEFDN